MKKRVAAAFLWFYTGWYAGALVAATIGISPVFGPMLGVAAAVLIVGDPRRIIWTPRASATAEIAPEAA